MTPRWERRVSTATEHLIGFLVIILGCGGIGVGLYVLGVLWGLARAIFTRGMAAFG